MVSTVTPHSDMAPSPRVDVFVDDFDLDGSTATITVWQLSAAGELKVRNGIDRASAGGFPITDFEVPLGIPVTYRVEQFNTAGSSIGYAPLTLETQVNIADGIAVFQDPLVPGHAVAVEALYDFGSKLVRSRPVRTYRAGYKTVGMMGLRGLLQDVPLRCQTQSLEDADMLDLVLAETQVLVRLMPSGGRLPAIFMVMIPSAVQLPVDVQYGGEWVEWDLEATEVTRTELDVLVSVYSWQDIINFFDTWADVIAFYSTWLTLLREPPPEA